MIEIDIDPADPKSRLLWHGVRRLTVMLPSGWVLIGGLMVQLHAFEREQEVQRLTSDIDVLGKARPQGELADIDTALLENNFESVHPDLESYGFRYEQEEIVVDVLAPDGIKPPPTLRPGVSAIEVPGGSQALRRSEAVEAHLDDHAFTLRRPNLLGAILMKARSLMVHSDPDSQREDLRVLLSFVEDPRTMALELKSSERKWLSKAQPLLDASDTANLNEEDLRRSSLALRLLLRDDAS